MEQLFGARIGARIKQLFGARIRDPKGTAFRGPNRGPNRTTFRGPGLLAVDVSLGALWRPPFQSFRSPNGIRLFGARIRDPNGTAFRGPNRGPNRTTFRPGALGFGCFSRGSWEATVSICTFVSTSHLFGARMVYDFSGPESGTRMEQLFGARIGPNRTTFRGPGLLAVDVPPGALWRPPFQSAHLCPPAIFSGPEWNDFLGPEPSARMVVFFLWCLNTLCKLDLFVFWGSKA